MTISTEKKVWTDEEFMALSKDEHRYELVNGELVDIGNSGMDHAYVACILVALLTTFVQQNKLGVVYDSSTAFTLKNGNKRSPDVSFVSKERLKGLKRPPSPTTARSCFSYINWHTARIQVRLFN